MCRHFIFIPIVFFNLSANDCHLFVKNLGEDKRNLNLISCNEEKYISFLKKKDNEHGHFRFIDSFRFFSKDLHDKFNDLPLAPEKRTPPGGEVPKLLCHFYDKKQKIISKKICRNGYLTQCLESLCNQLETSKILNYKQMSKNKKQIN